MFKRDWFGGGFKERLPVMLFMQAFMLLYFPINQFNATRGGFVPRLDAIDGAMPLMPIFVVPYAIGFAMMGGFPFLASIIMPRALFQQYMLGLFTVIVIGFSIWLLFPAYVIKAPIEGSGFFTDLLKMLHDGDATYGTHNAIPSSHVYYITLATLYFVQLGRRWFWPMTAFAIVNALSTMLTHQHYFMDVLAGFAVTIIAFQVSRRLLVPYVRKLETRYTWLNRRGVEASMG